MDLKNLLVPCSTPVSSPSGMIGNKLATLAAKSSSSSLDHPHIIVQSVFHLYLCICIFVYLCLYLSFPKLQCWCSTSHIYWHKFLTSQKVACGPAWCIIGHHDVKSSFRSWQNTWWRKGAIEMLIKGWFLHLICRSRLVGLPWFDSC